MQSPSPLDPLGLHLTRLFVALCEILELHMDEVFLGLAPGSLPLRSLDSLDPKQRAADAANRIVVLSGCLIEQIRRYEDTRWWELPDDLPLAPSPNDEPPDDDIPW